MSFQGNTSTLRGAVTVSLGAAIAGTAVTVVTASFPGAAIGDTVIAVPQATNASAQVAELKSPRVTTANVVSIAVANLNTATVNAGTAVGYNITLIKQTGEDNVV